MAELNPWRHEVGVYLLRFKLALSGILQLSMSSDRARHAFGLGISRWSR